MSKYREMIKEMRSQDLVFDTILGKEPNFERQYPSALDEEGDGE